MFYLTYLSWSLVLREYADAALSWLFQQGGERRDEQKARHQREQEQLREKQDLEDSQLADREDLERRQREKENL